MPTSMTSEHPSLCGRACQPRNNRTVQGLLQGESMHAAELIMRTDCQEWHRDLCADRSMSSFLDRSACTVIASPPDCFIWCATSSAAPDELA